MNAPFVTIFLQVLTVLTDCTNTGLHNSETNQIHKATSSILDFPKMIQEKIQSRNSNSTSVDMRQGGASGGGGGSPTGITATTALGFLSTVTVLYKKSIPAIMLLIKWFLTPGIFIIFILVILAPGAAFVLCSFNDCLGILGSNRHEDSTENTIIPHNLRNTALYLQHLNDVFVGIEEGYRSNKV